MRRTAAIGAFASATLLVWVAVSANQVQSTPGPGSGIVPVTGTVAIGNTPFVTAIQGGEWRMAVANTPTVIVAVPEFLKKGTRYAITWPSGEREVLTTIQVDSGAWVRVESADRRQRWINIALARSIEEIL